MRHRSSYCHFPFCTGASCRPWGNANMSVVCCRPRAAVPRTSLRCISSCFHVPAAAQRVAWRAWACCERRIELPCGLQISDSQLALAQAPTLRMLCKSQLQRLLAGRSEGTAQANVCLLLLSALRHTLPLMSADTHVEICQELLCVVRDTGRRAAVRIYPRPHGPQCCLVGCAQMGHELCTVQSPRAHLS